MALSHIYQAPVFESPLFSPNPYFKVSSSSCLSLNSHLSSSYLSSRSSSAPIRKLGYMASSTSPRRLVTTNYLRHVESMKKLPSGAGRIAHLNAVILGESLVSEENDLICPSDEFTKQALVSSPEQVNLIRLFFFFIIFFKELSCDRI